MISPYQLGKKQFNIVFMQDCPKLCCRTTSLFSHLQATVREREEIILLVAFF
jgi:hypothetical protein